MHTFPNMNLVQYLSKTIFRENANHLLKAFYAFKSSPGVVKPGIIIPQPALPPVDLFYQ